MLQGIAATPACAFKYMQVTCHYNEFAKSQTIDTWMTAGGAVHLLLDMTGVDDFAAELPRIEHLRTRLNESGGRLVLINVNSVQFASLHLFDCLRHYLPHNYTLAIQKRVKPKMMPAHRWYSLASNPD